MENKDVSVWAVGYSDREFAREMGDPVLARVEAVTFEEAMAKARKLGLDTRMSGLWVWVLDL